MITVTKGSQTRQMGEIQFRRLKGQNRLNGWIPVSGLPTSNNRQSQSMQLPEVKDFVLKTRSEIEAEMRAKIEAELRIKIRAEMQNENKVQPERHIAAATKVVPKRKVAGKRKPVRKPSVTIPPHAIEK